MKRLFTKLTLGVAAAGLLSIAAISAARHSDTMTSSPRQDTGTSTDVTFYGALQTRNSWQGTGGTPATGIYRFDFTSEDEVAVSPTSTTQDIAYGVYVDGYFYSFKLGTYTTKSFNYTLSKYDADSWNVESTLAISSSTMPESRAYTLAYDYITNSVYASSPEDPYAIYYNYSDLRKVNLETGEFTNIGRIVDNNRIKIRAMAFDSNGDLWGFSDGNVGLYKIDTATGVGTLISYIGYTLKPDEAASAIYDHRNGKMYWLGRTNDQGTLLLEVNTSTGTAQIAKQFTDNEGFTALYIRDAHPEAPDAVKNLEFAYDANSHVTGSVKFNAPAVTYAQKTYSGKMSAEIYIDNQLYDTQTGLAPGAAVSVGGITLEAAKTHKVRVLCYSADGKKGAPSEISTYAGEDIPSKVTNIVVTTTDRGDKATISWDPVTTGANGGYLDLDAISYSVIRLPENAVVADDIKVTTVEDTPDRSMAYSQYVIIAYGNSGNSGYAYSSPLLVGKAYDVPYIQTFDTQTAFNSFVSIDANGDGCNGWENCTCGYGGCYGGDKFFYDSDNKCAEYFVNYVWNNWSDDWMITPTLNLSSDNVYSVQFNTYGFSSGDSQTEWTITAGALPTVESQSQIIVKESFLTPIDAPRTVSGTFIPQEGACRIGFHLVTDWKDHATFDNVYVSLYGPSTIPAAATAVSSVKNKGKVTITATMPRVDAKGDAISSLEKFEVVRDDKVIATVENPAVGSTVNVEDAEPTLGVNTYKLYAYNASGKGLVASTSIDVRPDVPKAVENFSVIADNNGQEAVLSWNYPADGLGIAGEAIDPEDITYTIYYTANYVTTQVAKVSGTVNTYRDLNVSQYVTDAQQAKVKYTIVPSTLKGSGDSSSAEEIFGRSYELPFSCSFEDNTVAPWEGNSWAVGVSAYDPQTSAQDGTNVASMISTGSSELVSPRINLSGLINPHLTFYLYQDDQSTANNSYIQVGLVNAAAGSSATTQYVSDVIRVKASTAGWKLYDIDLSAYGTWNRVSLVFLGVSSNSKSRIHIDNVNITGERPDYDIKAVSLSGPAIARMGYDNIYTATIENVGLNDYDSFKVELLRNGEVLDQTTLGLASGERVEVPMTFAPALTEETGETWLTLRVTAANDVNSADDETMYKVTVLYPNLPYVNDLQGTGKGDSVELQWSDASSYPNDISITDDFESYDRFVTDGIGDWTLIDADGASTIAGVSNSSTSQVITWDNAGDPQAYIVFDPLYLSLTDLCTAYSGRQCLASFCSSDKNDDWLISPLLSGAAQTVTFYARCMNSYYTNERFEFRYSMSGMETEDFKLVKRETVGTSSWNKYSYEIPAGARYFAIRCISNNQFAFMLDDVTYEPAQEVVEFTGYNIYRDGVKIAGEVGETTYRDTDIHSSTARHTYFVSAQYEEGESAYSNEVTVDVSAVGAIADDAQIDIYGRNHSIFIEGAAGSNVAVYTPAGQVLYQFVAKANLETISLQPGIYIVRAGSKTAKIAVN